MDIRTPRHPRCSRRGCAGLCTEAGLTAAHLAYRSRLLGVARRVVVDPHLAEEAVQEAFVKAWRACATFDPDSGPILPWLVRITRNVAIDMARARTRRPPVAAGQIGPEDLAGEPTPGHEELILLRHELSGALRTLTTEHREAVVQTVLHGRPHGEVAVELGIPSGTVRSRTHYALRQLRKVIEASRECAPCPA